MEHGGEAGRGAGCGAGAPPYNNQAAIAAVTTNRASQPSACDTPTRGCIFVQITMLSITGAGAAIHAITAVHRAPFRVSVPAQMHRYMKAAQLIAPINVDARIDRVSLSPGLSRQTSCVARLCWWKSCIFGC